MNKFPNILCNNVSPLEIVKPVVRYCFNQIMFKVQLNNNLNFKFNLFNNKYYINDVVNFHFFSLLSENP